MSAGGDDNIDMSSVSNALNTLLISFEYSSEQSISNRAGSKNGCTEITVLLTQSIQSSHSFRLSSITSSNTFLTCSSWSLLVHKLLRRFE